MKNTKGYLANDIRHIFCCLCVSKERPLSVILFTISLIVLVLGTLFLFIGAVVSSQTIPHNPSIEVYNAYASGYNASLVFDNILPASIAVSQITDDGLERFSDPIYRGANIHHINVHHSSQRLSSHTGLSKGGDIHSVELGGTVTVENITYLEVPNNKEFAGLDNEDIALLYADSALPAYDVQNVYSGLVQGTFSEQEYKSTWPQIQGGGKKLFRNTKTMTVPPPPQPFVFDKSIRDRVVPYRRRAVSAADTPPSLFLAVTFLGSAGPTHIITRTVNNTQYAVNNGPAVCSDGNGCTLKAMNAICMEECSDCYFMSTSSETYMKKVVDVDDPIVCRPSQGDSCGLCVYEIYLTSYCMVIDVNQTTDTIFVDSEYESCNWPFSPENQEFIRVTAYGYPTPNISSVIIRSKNDPYLYLQNLTQGTMTFMITWPAFRSQGAVMAVLGCYLILMGILGALLLCCLSRRLYCCPRNCCGGEANGGEYTRLGKVSYLNNYD